MTELVSDLVKSEETTVVEDQQHKSSNKRQQHQCNKIDVHKVIDQLDTMDGMITQLQVMRYNLKQELKQYSSSSSSS